MDELLRRFLEECDEGKIVDCALPLSGRNDPEDLPFLLRALEDRVEARRLGAIYALGDRRDGTSAVVPLMKVLLNVNESIWVRSAAAEALGTLGQRRAIKPLIRGSRDASPEIRFWCVFALGQITCFRRKQLTRAGMRALEARLKDMEEPVTKGYWPIRLEALAMLRDNSPNWSEGFQAERDRVLADPLSPASLLRWADHYARGRLR